MRWIAAVAIAAAACRGGSPPAPPHRTAPPPAPPPASDGTAAISGHVIDQVDHEPVAGATVVLASATGERTALAGADGGFALRVPRGRYRAFVRGSDVLSVGFPDRVRLDPGPREALVGVPDRALMPTLDVDDDLANVELSVVRDARIAGVVVDGDGRPIAHAIVRARGGGLQPALATDSAVSGADGAFVLRVAPGRYRIDAAHPRFAGVADVTEVDALVGQVVRARVELARGCEIRGHVVRADGTPSGDGAIERRLGDSDLTFGPAGRIEADGTFRWVTTELGEITLRAWPWKSAPSAGKTVACAPGAHHDVTFALPVRPASLAGTIVDATGAPVPLAFVDVMPLDPDSPWSQQERGDAGGSWQVFDMPAGRYQITAAAPRRGIVVTTVVAPRDDIQLQLSGSGRIEGTVELADGTFELAFEACFDALDRARQPLAIAHDPRLVIARGGRFAIDGVPACDLALVARWRDRVVHARVPVAPGQVAHVELDLGPPRAKTVHGIVRDRDARPIANARVTSVFEGNHASATTDADGRYTLGSYAGAQLVAGDGDHVGSGVVGRANISDEEVDLTVQ
ncbi:MAG TPA: carboxypeptidase regulatory-like domain-containing protein [Kofleriaceae bacterium]|nr:carboxypeptidase regulatory-like domain-containing protein [Kofleriaceae bacterium]